MAKYACPVITCNVGFEGSMDDIAPPAMAHAQGSHQTIVSIEEVMETVQKQADPNYQKTPINQPVEVSSDPVVKKGEDQAISNWWKSLDKK